MLKSSSKMQLLSSFLIATLFISCADPEESQSMQDTAPCISESMAEMISIDEVLQQQSKKTIVLPGQVTVNQDRVYRVYPAAGGIISDVHVRLGDQVIKGQILATVQSPDIAEFRRDKRSALAEKSITERNLRLAESLFESGVYSERDLLEARSSFERAESEVERLREQQMVLGIDDDQTTYTIRAPEAGFVVERNINPGLSLRAGDDHVFEISDLTDVWVVANVSESDISYVSINSEVTITTVAYPEHNFTGEIVRLSSALDPNRRTMEAIIELPNPDFMLKPGMFATINVTVEKEDTGLSIDNQSLIFDNNKYYVVVYRDPCDMAIRPVSISSQSGDRVFVESGVEEGESVVSNRQILIYNELTINGNR